MQRMAHSGGKRMGHDEQSGVLVFQCIRCAHTLRISSERVGQIGRCPRCQANFELAPQAQQALRPTVNRARIARRNFVKLFVGTTCVLGGGTWAILHFFREEDHGRSKRSLGKTKPSVPEDFIDDKAPPEWADIHPLRVACVGDSITYGNGLDKREITCYPAVLERLLAPAFEVRNFASGGRSVLSQADYPYVKEKVYREALAYQPHIV